MTKIQRFQGKRAKQRKTETRNYAKLDSRFRGNDKGDRNNKGANDKGATFGKFCVVSRSSFASFRASSHREDDGFTLMEFLIYIGIVVFLISSLTSISLNVLRVRAKINAMDRVSRNTEMAMNTITNMIQNAKSVNSAGGSLDLEIYQSHNDPTVFTLSDGKIMMSRGGRAAIPITTEGVEITNMTFTNPTSRMVEIEITMKNVNPQNLFYYEFEGTFNTKENVRHSE